MWDSVGHSDCPATPPPEDVDLSLDRRSEVGTKVKPEGKMPRRSGSLALCLEFQPGQEGSSTAETQSS